MESLSESDRRRSTELLGLLPDDEALEELVRLHLPLAEYLARRFQGRGEPLDDLIQVASLGLIKAIKRFDPDRGVEFSTYATPTIVGEIKRHFRDQGWAVRVPRRMQELSMDIARVIPDLAQDLGRSPKVPEIAQRLGRTEEEVLEGIEAAGAYSTQSLDAPSGEDDEGRIAELGGEDESVKLVEAWTGVEQLLGELQPREARIVYLRFVKGMTQSEIAAEIGISQMHVSRLLARTIHFLRSRADASNSG